MKTRWYKDAVFYQIYPRSFCDSNGDGVGDIRGIISKLDYLKGLGIDAVWLSPCYKSPNDDNGYDIADYRDIMDEFGTLDDWKEMISGLHERGIKLVMDLVVNHTSDEHKWFKESRKSKDNPYRDYYIWRKGRGKDGKKAPNNWTSRFFGPAWKYDEQTNEWYLHLFSEKQPDLNWDNPKVRSEVRDICNYWFELGVDGFRCDVITYISKVEGLPNGKGIGMVGDDKFVIGPHFHEYIQELNRESWSKYDTMIVGEGAGINIDNVKDVVEEKRGELDSVFTFEHYNANFRMGFFPKKMNLPYFKRRFYVWQAGCEKYWTSPFLENHDFPRIVGTYVNREYREVGAKMIAMFLLSLRGTPYIYQGQELGMSNLENFMPEEYKDIVSINLYNTVKKLPIIRNYIVKTLNARARDHARTPMQWSNGKNAGFTSGEPWMKINPDYNTVNAESELADESSVLAFYKKMLGFRKGNKLLRDGTYRDILPRDKKIFAFERQLNGDIYLVVCNFTDKNAKFSLPEEFESRKELFVSVMSNYGEERKLESRILKPYEGQIFHLKSY